MTLNAASKTILTLCFLILWMPVYSQTSEQHLSITNFIVKENLLKNEKIAIIACDAEEKPLEHITGTFQFSLNGFKQDLKFNDGIAVAPQPVDKSAFMYIRHTNEQGTTGKLYYIIKRGTDLTPVKISWLMLVIIPLAIIFITMIFRKFLLIAIVLLVVVFFFNLKNGLTIPTFFDTVFDGLKSLI